MKRLSGAWNRHMPRSEWNQLRHYLGDTSAHAAARKKGLRPPLPVHEAKLAFFAATIEKVRHLRRPGVQLDLF